MAKIRILGFMLIAALTMALLPSSMMAAGIQVSPAELNVSGPAGKIVKQDLVVANPTTDVQLFEVSADDFEKNIQPRPASFTLEAGSRKTVVLEITPLADQKITTNISVVGRPLAGASLQTNTGVKIPITISAGASKAIPWWVWAIAGAIIVLAAIGIIIQRNKNISTK